MIKRVPPGKIEVINGRYYYAGDVLPNKEDKKETPPPIPVVELTKESEAE